MSEVTADTGTKSRYSIDLDEPHRAALAALAKTYKITQGEVIEVMIDFVGEANQIAPALIAKREAKVARRAPKKDLYQQFKNMSPEQIQAALAAAQAIQAKAV